MTADKTPLEDAVEQALDAFLYAPIGLLFDGPARFPKLVRNGRSQITNARMMGQFAVQMGQAEVTKRTADLDGPVLDLLRGLGIAPTPTPTPAPAPTPTEEPAAQAEPAKAPAGKRPAKKTSAKKATKKAPAKKASTRKAPAKKTTVPAPSAGTAAAKPSPAELPITDYDSLSASQVVSRLRGLSEAQLEDVRVYEAATRGRKTILNKVQQLK